MNAVTQDRLMKMNVSSSNKISSQLEEQFCTFIRQYMGIIMQDHQLPTLRDTLLAACEVFSLDSPQAYYEKLHQAEKGSREFEFLVSGITVGESYFFRDTEQINFLRNNYLPELIYRKREKNDLSIRIWSAGCSHGQEVVTLAILLTELIPDMHDWNIHLLGTDINISSLTKAVKAKYSSWSFRAMSDEQCSRYFTKEGKLFSLKPEIKALTRFSYLNLTEDSFPSFMTQTECLDLILCRNVFIYFNKETATPVMNKFSKCLADGGCLLLGASDQLVTTISDLKLNTTGQIQYYNKQEKFTAQPATTPIKKVKVKETEDKKRKSLSTKLKESVKNNLLKIKCPELPAKSIQTEKTTVSLDSKHKNCIRLIKDAKWQDALNAINVEIQLSGENSVLYQLQAKAFANTGDIIKAAESCELSIKLDSLDKHSHLLYGVILVELNRLEEAEKTLLNALFLDSNFLEAYFQLGLLQVRKGQIKRGINSLKNALQLAEKEDPEREVHESSGLSFARLVEILRVDIKLYSNMDEDQ